MFLAEQFESLQSHLDAMMPAAKKPFLQQFYSQVRHSHRPHLSGSSCPLMNKRVQRPPSSGLFPTPSSRLLAAQPAVTSVSVPPLA